MNHDDNAQFIWTWEPNAGIRRTSLNVWSGLYKNTKKERLTKNFQLIKNYLITIDEEGSVAVYKNDDLIVPGITAAVFCGQNIMVDIIKWLQK